MRRHRPVRQGATAVEFAMISPILFICIFAGVEFVRANIIRHTAENAAFCASRTVMVPGATKAEAIEKANAVLAMAGVRDAEITFTPEVIDETTTHVSTEISVPMNQNSWGLGAFMKDRAIIAEATMRTERSPVVQAQALPTILNPPPPEPTPEPDSSPEPESSPEPDSDSDSGTETEPYVEPAPQPTEPPPILL